VAPLVPSTGVLRTFSLQPYKEGFLLSFPHKETPDTLAPFVDDPVLYAIAKETRERSRVLGVASVGALNKVNASKGIKDYIQVAEALQNKKIAAIADAIAAKAGEVKVVLIAGPSSSGKTTTLYSMLNEVDRMTRNVITVEDPIEAHLPGVSQLEINAKADITSIIHGKAQHEETQATFSNSRRFAPSLIIRSLEEARFLGGLRRKR